MYHIDLTTILQILQGFRQNSHLFAELPPGTLGRKDRVAAHLDIVEGKVTDCRILSSNQFATGLVITHGGLGVYNLPTFDLLAISELLAVSLLLPRSVFVVALANSIFIWVDIAYFRHDAQLGQLLASSGYGIVARPIVLQVIVAVVTYLWHLRIVGVVLSEAYSWRTSACASMSSLKRCSAAGLSVS